MRKRSILALCLAGVLLMQSSAALAVQEKGISVQAITIQDSTSASGTCGTNLRWTLNSSGTLTISGSGAMTNWTSSTSMPWYSVRGSIKSVVIQSGVTTIGNDAFYNCSFIKSVTIPGSVTSIGEYAFSGCYQLTSVTIPMGVTRIGYAAFNACSALTSIDLPDTVAKIEASAFSSCSALKSITVRNPRCEIEDNYYTLYSGATIYGYAGSTAQTYAQKYSLNFVSSLGETSHLHSYDAGVITKAATCGATGSKKYTCTICGETKNEPIPATGSHTYNTTTTKAKPGANGKTVTKCSVCGTVKSTTTIYAPKTLTLSATSYTYNGKAQKPTVKVKDSKGNTISSTHYTVSYASGRKYVGSYKVTVTFKGSKYSGSMSKTFVINPKATALSSVTAASKGFTARWSKVTTQTTGYQLQYSTSSKFTNAKTVTITSNKTTSKKITKLSAKKKYYVRVRTYKTVSGKKYYSSWSSAKAVTTKK